MSLNKIHGRAAIIGLAALVLVSSHAFAQEPNPYPYVVPEWQVDIPGNTIKLTPESANLALGQSSASTTLHVMGGNVTSYPGTGYVNLGPSDSLHMQLDRNDIRVSGSTSETVGTLYLQRYGGPMVVHGSEGLGSRIYITNDGDVGVATANPRAFAVDRDLIGPGWIEPPGELAVDGDIYAERMSSIELQVLDELRIGRRVNPILSGAAEDTKHKSAILQVAGLISAQKIAVHIDSWADDVFSDDYALMPLSDLEEYIDEERHLPGIPSEDEVKRTGIDLAETNEKLLRKVEELTLYTIEQQKKIDELERKIDDLGDK